jgi:hypothetical protein
MIGVVRVCYVVFKVLTLQCSVARGGWLASCLCLEYQKSGCFFAVAASIQRVRSAYGTCTLSPSVSYRLHILR